jgi:hypothetical protein
MRMFLHLAATLALTGALATHAQITNPDALIAPPPRNPAQHKPIQPTDDLQWLWQYTRPEPDGDALALVRDPRFAILLRNQLTAPQPFWRDGADPLWNVASQYFGVTQGGVHSSDNRYITVSGCVPHQCRDQGLLWLDTAPPHPWLVFVATAWVPEGHSYTDPQAAFNLWLFPTRSLDPQHPPASLVHAISEWNRTAPQLINAAIVVDPDGTPHKVNPTLLGATSSTVTSHELPQ